MKQNRHLQGLTMFVFNFGLELLEQSVKLGWLIINNYCLFPWKFPSLNTTFSKLTTKKQCFLLCFYCKSCFSACVLLLRWWKKTYLKRSLANFQRIQMLLHPRLAFNWLSVSSLIIDRSEFLVCYFFALTWPSSALNNLKTAFILTNQNWAILSCILLCKLQNLHF